MDTHDLKGIGFSNVMHQRQSFGPLKGWCRSKKGSSCQIGPTMTLMSFLLHEQHRHGSSFNLIVTREGVLVWVGLRLPLAGNADLEPAVGMCLGVQVVCVELVSSGARNRDQW